MIFISIHALLTESDCVACCIISDRPNISIHALLTESDLGAWKSYHVCGISIHALLTESDRSPRVGFCRPRYFYPRSPYGERHYGFLRPSRVREFLSTLSLRRATPNTASRIAAEKDFYPRSPYGERRLKAIIFSIMLTFLSTLSLRRATIVGGAGNNAIRISIHALLTESDSKSAQNSGALLRI